MRMRNCWFRESWEKLSLILRQFKGSTQSIAATRLSNMRARLICFHECIQNKYRWWVNPILLCHEAGWVDGKLRSLLKYIHKANVTLKSTTHLVMVLQDPINGISFENLQDKLFSGSWTLQRENVKQSLQSWDRWGKTVREDRSVRFWIWENKAVLTDFLWPW